MAIRRPATVASRESLVLWRLGRYPGCIGVFRLKNQQRWDSHARGTPALNCSYPLLSAADLFPTARLTDIDQYSRQLTRSNGKSRLVHVVDVIWIVLVMHPEFRHYSKPPLHAIITGRSVLRSIDLTRLDA